MTFVVVVNGNDEVCEETEEPSALESPMTTEERRVCGPGAIREEEAERRQEGVEAVDRDDRKERCSERNSRSLGDGVEEHGREPKKKAKPLTQKLTRTLTPGG